MFITNLSCLFLHRLCSAAVFWFAEYSFTAKRNKFRTNPENTKHYFTMNRFISAIEAVRWEPFEQEQGSTTGVDTEHKD